MLKCQLCGEVWKKPVKEIHLGSAHNVDFAVLPQHVRDVIVTEVPIPQPMTTAAPALLNALEAMHEWLCEHWGDGPINGDDLSLVDVGIAAEIAIQEARGD